MPETGKSLRIGFSGAPGVGKSTLIEIFGMLAIEKGHQVAVLAIDPSSPISGGSILGDRTRMEKLSSHNSAFIRPTPTGGTLGGVARHTRETILAVEASGYDVVIVETVGVGQSEALAASMVDVFVILQLPNAGDELQGIKKGVLELADIVVITKCDGPFESSAKAAASDIKQALSLTRGEEEWQPPVLTSSAQSKTGFDTLWKQIETFKKHQDSSGGFANRRKSQSINWFDEEVDLALIHRFRQEKSVTQMLEKFRCQVQSGELAASVAALDLIDSIFAQFD
jgi:LAO/AO transport system kinase